MTILSLTPGFIEKGEAMIAKYDKEGNIEAVGDNCHDLARILKITPSAVSHAIHRGSKLYIVIDDEEGEEDD